MNYIEAVEFIESVSWKGSVPGLERISELCRLLGHPERKVRYVHIAGTNGKGSVSSIVSSVLTAAGYKTGLFTSPHLIKYTERFKIDGEDISEEEFCRAAETVREQSVKMEDAPTEFELLTAMAFVYFASRECDVAVLECGMGGRLDATNVIESPVLSVITNIALDHTAILGDTELKIAHEKAGIIKGAPTVVGKTSPDVENYLKDICRTKGVLFIGYTNADVDIKGADENGIGFSYKGLDCTLPLCAEYQKINLRTAIAAAEVLNLQGFAIDGECVKRGAANVRWIGRFEKLQDDPAVIFDGAHNPDGAEFTAKTFGNLYKGRRAVLVTGVMADKNYEAVADILSEISLAAFTVAPDNPRALDAGALSKVYSARGVPSKPFGNVEDAVTSAVKLASEKNVPVLCTGSLYMYADIVKAVERRE